MLPLHDIVNQLGESLSNVVVKAHILTGNDCVSKVGTKRSALSCNPVQYLMNIGVTDTLSEHDIALAEEYLVHCWAGTRSVTSVKTFGQFRHEVYTSAVRSIDKLPPTSSSIRGHIHRAAYLIFEACNLLQDVHEKSEHSAVLKHGWEERFGIILPCKALNPLPTPLLSICKCLGKCDTLRCVCIKAKLNC